MNNMRKTVLVFTLFLAFMSLHERAFGWTFGAGAKDTCRDYLNNQGGLRQDQLFTWFEGYISNNDQVCVALRSTSDDKKTARSCLSDKIRIVPGVGGSFDGKTSFSSDLKKRLYAACYANPDQDFFYAMHDTLNLLDKDYNITFPHF